MTTKKPKSDTFQPASEKTVYAVNLGDDVIVSVEAESAEEAAELARKEVKAEDKS